MFFFYFGIVLGVVFSATTVPGAVWCVQITLHRGFFKGLLAGVSIACAQVILAALAAFIVFWMARFSSNYDWLFRVFSASVLAYLCTTVFGAARLRDLCYDGPLRGGFEIFQNTFMTALTMPMRLPGYIALLIAMNLHLRQHDLAYSVVLGTGIGVGSLGWWGYFSMLAAAFGHRVPEPISVRSMNKLRVLAGAVLAALVFIGIAPLVPGFQ
jgi:threonine/homoserine/homoserine lactone efflux protein